VECCHVSASGVYGILEIAGPEQNLLETVSWKNWSKGQK